MAKDGWGQYGSSKEHERYIDDYKFKSLKRRCSCGCDQMATHAGMANGVCLTIGCELSIRRWVRDGFKSY
ncbi:hypothetical protein CJ419_09765 [Vibrio navarrensis]|nr:hypothetical protein [Vibrio navarrensis]